MLPVRKLGNRAVILPSYFPDNPALRELLLRLFIASSYTKRLGTSDFADRSKK